MLRRTPRRRGASVLALVLVPLLLTACSAPLKPQKVAETSTPPKLATCYSLTPADTEKPSTDAAPVACSAPHTAQTFAVGTLPDSTGKAYKSPAHGKWVYRTCQRAFEKFLSVDTSLAMRVRLSWAWFRPSSQAWDKGSRWYRCDVVGGPAEAKEYLALPTVTKGLFRAKPPEQWLSCALGESVLKSQKVSCAEPHNWRAVTTIKLGGPRDPYPGDRISEVRSRDFCSDSVGAWMNYPVEYEFGYTWFHEAEWSAGNRRAVCWAKTDR